ncbi:MAG: AIR synthase-related protein [bacterium]|nr:AIR synthase-related protein [bacterium]
MSEYSRAGVDYRLIKGYKQKMIEMGKRTWSFPERRGVRIVRGGVHYYFQGARHMWKQVTEGLGNKNWIASWMEWHNKTTGRSYYEGIGQDTMRMADNDLLPFRALSVVYTDETAAGLDAWFSESPQRMSDLIGSFYKGCQEVDCALTQGESPALKHLIDTLPPPGMENAPFHAPSFSGCATGIISPPERWLCIRPVEPGNRIIALASSDWHCNGASLIIKRAMELPDQFMTLLSNGKTLGEQALTVTTSYTRAVERLLQAADIRYIQPITGGGITKLASYPSPFRYRVEQWLPVPPVCSFMREIGVTVKGCYETFNMGVGLVMIVPESDADYTIDSCRASGYEADDIGVVEAADEPEVILEHEGGLRLVPLAD